MWHLASPSCVGGVGAACRGINAQPLSPGAKGASPIRDVSGVCQGCVGGVSGCVGSGWVAQAARAGEACGIRHSVGGSWGMLYPPSPSTSRRSSAQWGQPSLLPEVTPFCCPVDFFGPPSDPSGFSMGRPNEVAAMGPLWHRGQLYPLRTAPPVCWRGGYNQAIERISCHVVGEVAIHSLPRLSLSFSLSLFFPGSLAPCVNIRVLRSLLAGCDGRGRSMRRAGQQLRQPGGRFSSPLGISIPGPGVHLEFICLVPEPPRASRGLLGIHLPRALRAPPQC